MTRLTLYRIAIKGISQHKTPLIAKLPHANRGATDKKSHFRSLVHQSSVTNFCTKKFDSQEEGSSVILRDESKKSAHLQPDNWVICKHALFLGLMF